MIRTDENRGIEYGIFEVSVPKGTLPGAVIANPKYSLKSSVEREWLGCGRCGERADDWAFMADDNHCLNCGLDAAPVTVRQEAEPLMLRVRNVRLTGGSNAAFDRQDFEGWTEYRAICTPVAE